VELQFEELQAASAIDERVASSAGDRPLAAKPFRRPLPAHLPREIHTDMPDRCARPDCAGKLCVLSEDVAEMPEYVRACLRVPPEREFKHIKLFKIQPSTSPSRHSSFCTAPDHHVSILVRCT
jgi:transposase